MVLFLALENKAKAGAAENRPHASGIVHRLRYVNRGNYGGIAFVAATFQVGGFGFVVFPPRRLQNHKPKTADYDGYPYCLSGNSKTHTVDSRSGGFWISGTRTGYVAVIGPPSPVTTAMYCLPSTL